MASRSVDKPLRSLEAHFALEMARGLENSVLPEGDDRASLACAIAVSGGADSTALALLAAAWGADKGVRIIALTVDHALRADSAAEAEQVGAVMRAHGIEHHILTQHWPDGAPASGIQAAARAARYRLMLAWCRQHHVPCLLFGHHRDDQCETFWQRLVRGSSIAGLSGMSLVRTQSDTALLRPLLGVAKAELVAWLQAKSVAWIEDPSNCSSQHQRNRMRAGWQQWQAQLSHEGLSDHRLAETITSLGEARMLLEQQLAVLLTSYVTLAPEGYAIVHCAVSDIPTALRIPFWQRLLTCVAGAEMPPRREQVEAMLGQIASPAFHAMTLHGALLWHRKGALWVSREPSAIDARPVPLRVVAEHGWDGRFVVSPPQGAPKDAMVQPLTTSVWNVIVSAASEANLLEDIAALPARVRASLPVVTGVEKAPFLPHITGGKVGCYFDPTQPLLPDAFITATPFV